MKFRIFVPRSAVSALELEQPSTALRTHLTRLLRRKVDTTEGEDGGGVVLARMNRLINRARTIMELPIYHLEADDWGDYLTAEYAWHYGEFELMFRRLDTIQFSEFVGELIQERFFSVKTINRLLEQDGLAAVFNDDKGLQVEVLSLSQVEELAKIEPHWHENIRLLIARMESSHDAKDFAAVIHAGASVFETLAKEVVGLPQVQNQTLKAFFARYRKDSALPKPILDHVEALYDRRNVTPLAGHGSLTPPPVLSEGESRTMVEMTKAFVAIEYKLKLAGATLTPHPGTGATAAADPTVAGAPQPGTLAPSGTPAAVVVPVSPGGPANVSTVATPAVPPAPTTVPPASAPPAAPGGVPPGGSAKP